MRKIRIHISFIPVCIYFLISGGIEKFLTMVLLTFFHEMGHILTAVFFDLNLTEILIMPIGQRAVIRDIYSVSALKRSAIFLSGPVLSLVLGGLIGFFDEKTALMSINIGLFNLIPFLPLDGGNFLMAALGSFVGDINSAKIVLRLSKMFSKMVVVFGFVWIVLYPYNLDFVVAGLFMYMVNKASSASIYSRILDALFMPKSLSSIKLIYCEKISRSILNKMNTAKFNVVVLNDNGDIKLIPQEDILKGGYV